MSRRAALQLAAGAGALVASAPYLARIGNGPDLFDARGVELISAPDLDWPVPPIVTRSQWGANESLRTADPIFNSAIRKLIVHHTGTPNDITDYAGLARGIYVNELNNGYIDIAYNWLIDPHGRIYEGRWAQNYPAGLPHTGERNRLNVMGAHALHFNTDTIGIGLMGDYSDISPTPAMVGALLTLMTWKCARWVSIPLPRLRTSTASTRRSRTSTTSAVTATPMRPRARATPSRRCCRCSGPRWRRGWPWAAPATGSCRAPASWSRSATFRTRGSDEPGAPIADPRRECPSERAGLLALQRRRWGVLVRRREVPRLDGIREAQPADHRHGGDAERKRLLARRGDGGVFCFGDAKFYGSTGGRRLNAPILGLTPTPSGNGYWLYARDGGVFCFGDAKFFGSTGSLRLNQPIVGMAARPQNDGYWIVAADGGVFCFGHAQFHGSAVAHFQTARCVSLTVSTTGRGYALLFTDGAVFTFGDAPFFGSAVGRLFGPAVGLAGRLAPLA